MTPRTKKSVGVLSVLIPVVMSVIAWLYGVGKDTAINSSAIKAFQESNTQQYQKLDQSIKDLQSSQRQDMSEIREELRYMNSRIDGVFEKKSLARAAIHEL